MKAQNENLTRAIVTEDGQVMIEQADGTYRVAGKGKTDFNKLDAMKDLDIDYSEIPELNSAFFQAASMPLHPKKQQLTIRIDSDLVEWLKQHGKGYQTRINTILRAYMQVQKNNLL